MWKHLKGACKSSIQWCGLFAWRFPRPVRPRNDAPLIRHRLPSFLASALGVRDIWKVYARTEANYAPPLYLLWALIHTFSSSIMLSFFGPNDVQARAIVSGRSSSIHLMLGSRRCSAGCRSFQMRRHHLVGQYGALRLRHYPSDTVLSVITLKST